MSFENYRTYALVNVDSVVQNLKNIKACVDSQVRIMAVVKADCYGHGSVIIVKAVEELVDSFGVASIDEAVEWRKSKTIKPILILGYTMHNDYQKVIQYNITQTIYSFTDAEALSKCAVDLGKKAVIHIAVDTGMGRIGFLPTLKSADIVAKISMLPNIVIDGLFTHFASADEKDKSFTIEQISKFDSFVDLLEARNIFIPLKHVCNSAGIMDFDHHRYQMVRAGIIMYGLYPSNDVMKDKLKIKPALEWKAHITNVKVVEKGSSISYGRTYITNSDSSRIATVSVGYADGYPRGLSNKGRVLIKGKSYPIVGRVCMDQFMVDISDLGGEEVQIEDIVTLIGWDGNEYISADEIARKIGTINYEVVCNISKRVPRVYIKT